MTVIIKKGAAEKEIQSAVKKMNKKNVRPRLTDFYGELRGKYGDGSAYQKEIRNDRD